jgi:hypothetical protein
MKRSNLAAAFALMVCALAGGASSEAQAQRRPVNRALGTQVVWTFEKNPRQLQYRFGDVTLSVRPYRAQSENEYFAPEVTISAPGRAPVVMRGSEVWPSAAHHIGVGRLDRAGNLFVELQSFTGGAHCCNEIQVAVIEPRQIRLVELGAWDGAPGKMPRDVDGDGMVDWVQRDDGFLYSFDAYAFSFSPPQIFNIIDGRAEDVSARPSFRPLFQRALNDARAPCLTRRRADASNSACATYVASAARIGQFGAAWERMSRAYNDKHQWEYPTGCRVDPHPETGCPDSATINYGGYLPSLRAFLADQGYIRP